MVLVAIPVAMAVAVSVLLLVGRRTKLQEVKVKL